MSNQAPLNDLAWFISETLLPVQEGTIVVVNWIGLLAKQNLRRVEECTQEIANSDATWVLLSFRDVQPHLDLSLVPALERFQRVVRAKPAELRLCSVHPILRGLMTTQGLVRPEELAPNLSTVLQSLPKLQAA